MNKVTFRCDGPDPMATKLMDPTLDVPAGCKSAPLEPTPEMIDAGAQRLVRWDDSCVWPDSWDALQISAARNEAERVWRSMWLAAAPVAGGGLPTELSPHNSEWYALCERARYVDQISISGPLAEAIVKAMVRLNAAAPQPPAEASGWRDIASAPKDGTPIDIWRSQFQERATNMRRTDLGNGNVFYSPVEAGPSCVRDATHWMPLPPAPEKSISKEERDATEHYRDAAGGLI